MGTILLIILILAPGRGATCLAVQFRLGLLAQRRIRLDSFDCYNSRFNGTSVNKHASARRRFSRSVGGHGATRPTVTSLQSMACVTTICVE